MLLTWVEIVNNTVYIMEAFKSGVHIWEADMFEAAKCTQKMLDLSL